MTDYHIHTTFSDGQSLPEEVVLSAISMGMTEIGISDHSLGPQHSAQSQSRMPEKTARYLAEIHRLREKYADKIHILCGMEQDLCSAPPPEGLDYLIGSAHYLIPQGEWFSVDGSKEKFVYAVENWYGGDVYALCEAYYTQLEKLADLPCDIIGHFDLITKFNEGGCLFDESHPRYLQAQDHALQVLMKTGRIFEINTGAISRGYRLSPYPCERVRRIILEGGGRLMLCSDSHRADTVGFRFDEWKAWANTFELPKKSS